MCFHITVVNCFIHPVPELRLVGLIFLSIKLWYCIDFHCLKTSQGEDDPILSYPVRLLVVVVSPGILLSVLQLVIIEIISNSIIQ